MPQLQRNFDDEQYQLIIDTQNASATSNWDVDDGDYIRLSVFDNTETYVGSFFSNQDHFQIYTSDDGNLYVAPNEVLNDSYNLIGENIGSGNYTLQYEFLYNPFSNYIFYIDKISPSRKEARVIIRDTSNEMVIITDEIMNSFKNVIGKIDYRNDIGQGDYNFDFIGALPKAFNLPIVNYGFDDVSDNTPSLVVRFDKSIPGTLKKLNIISIEQEKFTTQTEEISFISQDVWVSTVTGLDVDESFEVDYTEHTLINQSYEDLVDSGSLTDTSITNQILSGSFNYQNLNIDYNDFSNHTFFGSAISKIDNFVTKASEIEDYLVIISSSLQITGSTTDISASANNTGLITKRQKYFNLIQGVKDTFTPYEQFLYSDFQNSTTASAPGVGTNMAYQTPVAISGSRGQTFYNYEGFDVVYNHSGSADGTDSSGVDIDQVELFTNVYRAENPPFFNTDDPVYLSFLIKGDVEVTPSHSNYNVENDDYGPTYDWQIPTDAFGGGFIEQPPVTGSEWRRYILAASQSYWRPSGSGTDFGQDAVDGAYDIQDITNNDYNSPGSGRWEVLSGSNVFSASNSGSTYEPFAYGIKDSAGKHGQLLQPASMSADGTFDTNTARTGSVLPSGDLFRVYYQTNDNNYLTSSYITDVKVSMNNPTSSLPFSSLYSTSSNAWTDWYNSISSSAASYDEYNIHSLYNNLPKHIIESSEYNDLISFLNMQGEFYDLIRNYIDNYTNLNKRSYKDTETVPNNLLPILGDSLGWEFINTYTGSLETYFNSISDGGANLGDITNETWRKVLNNLIYIYKSKGTLNSVNALLNSYGYPSSFLKLQEHGASTSTTSTALSDINNSSNTNILMSGISNATGNNSYVEQVKPFYSLRLNNSASIERKINLDWQTNDAKGDGIEFIFKSNNTFQDQTLLESSGSGKAAAPGIGVSAPSGSFWDLSLSGSGEIVFRLNKSLSGSAPIATNNHAMSTSLYTAANYSSGSWDNKLWNVYLTRDTTTASLTPNATLTAATTLGTQSYILYTALQEGDSIIQYNTSSLLVTESIANQNFYGTGSIANTVSGNLVVGETLSGSVAEIRMWSGSLSASKFQHHVLDKFSFVGNDFNGWTNDRLYHFKLNENHQSGSTIPGMYLITDANPTVVNDYSRYHDLWQYNFDWISTYTFSPRHNNINHKNENNIIINDSDKYLGRLNPHTSIIKPITALPNQKMKTSTRISITHDPQDVIDNYISKLIPDMRISDKIPVSDRYEYAYSTLNEFRNTILKDVSVDINKNIRENKKLFNKSIINQVKKVLPGRAINTTGVVIRQDILQRNKYKHFPVNVENPDYMDIIDIYGYISIADSLLDTYNTEIDIDGTISLTNSSYETYQETTISAIDNILLSPTYEDSKNTSIDIIENISLTPTYKSTKNITIGVFDSILLSSLYNSVYEDEVLVDITTTDSTYNSTKNGLIDISDIPSKSFSYLSTYNDNIDVNNTLSSSYSKVRQDDISILLNSSVNYEKTKDALLSIVDYINTESEKMAINSSIIDIANELTTTSSYSATKDTTLNLASANPTSSYSATKDDILYVGYANPTSSYSATKDDTLNLASANPTSSYSATKDTTLNLASANPTSSYSATKDTDITIYTPTKFRDLDAEWGTGINDTHFVPPYKYFTGDINNFGFYSGSQGDYNTRHFEKRYTFKIIGADMEFVSGGLDVVTASQNPRLKSINFISDHTNFRHYKSREMSTNHPSFDKGIELKHSYRSYFPFGETSQSLTAPPNGYMPGRPMGRTSYFGTGSDGKLYYPKNHYIYGNTVKTDIPSIGYKGTQNTNPGFWPSTEDRNDLSTSSFYSVKVEESNRLEVFNPKDRQN